MGKTNILIVNGALYIGGAENVIANIMRYCDKERFSVSAYCTKGIGEIGTNLVDEGFNVTGAPAGTGRLGNLFRFRHLERIIKEREIHIIHSHDTSALVDAVLPKFRLGRKLIHTFHFGNYPHMERRYFLMEKFFARFPDLLVSVGENQGRNIRENFGHLDQKLKIVRNGVEDPFEHKDCGNLQVDLPKGKVVFGSISTLTEQKGLIYLLEAASMLKESRDDFVILIAGDGPLRAQLEAKTEDLGISGSVMFMGWIEDAAVRLLPKVDVFLQSSLWEAMSIVVLEAMAVGLPIVATSVGENPYVVEDGKSGFLTKPGDPGELAAMMRLLLEDADLRKDMGRRNRERYLSEFGVKQMVRRYEELYSQLV